MIKDRTSLKTGTRHRRRGYGLLELTLSVILLLAAMMMMVKMLGWVASERRAAERRQWAAQELSNAMERIVSEPFERVTTERASAVLADVPLYQALVSPEWEANVTDDSGSGGARAAGQPSAPLEDAERRMGLSGPTQRLGLQGQSQGEDRVLKATNRARRRGFTLFEIILVVAGASTLVATCAMLLHVLLRLDTVARSHLNDASTVSRLARQFREDVRTAAKADGEPAGQAPRLTLSTPGASTVIYQVEGDRLLRLESLGDKVVRRESYGIARLGPVAFEDDAGLIRLVLLRKPDEPGTAIRPRVRIDARVGKHRTLFRASEPKS